MKKAKCLFLFLIFSFNSFASLDSLIKKINSFESSLSIPDLNKKPLQEAYSFPQITGTSFERQEEKYRNFLSELESIKDKSLTEGEQIDKQVLQLKLFDALAYYQYQMYRIPFGAEGGFYNNAIYMIQRFEIKTLEDGNRYLNWLKHYCTYLEDYKEFLKKGMDKKILAPKVIVNNTIFLIGQYCDSDPLKNPFYAPFEGMSDFLSDKEIKHLSSVSMNLFQETVIPQYRELKRFMEIDYLPKAYDEPGIFKIPNGIEYYENRVKHYTTLPLTANQIHQTGLEEVKRIKARMIELINSSGYEGSFEEFIEYLRSHPRFYARSPQELLHYAAWLSKKAEGELPKYFNRLPSLPFTVEEVPASIAATYTSGRYSHGSWKGKRPGSYLVNTYKLDSRPLYTMPALTLHEAVPGHHLQNQLIAESDNVSDLRRNYYISAFGEGWGLYSEFLGEEMGMYSDEYELFGRLTYEMWRACRLVVDTGIHLKGWSREKALEFLKSNTALSVHEVNTEIDRYIGWPGQALSYKIGEMKIKDLRKKAEMEMGEAFDIREFHFQILKNGSIPLPILENVIDNYIQENK